MNKFKLLLTAALPLLLVGVALASPLDLIYDAPGNFWGKIDGSPTNGAADHVQFEAQQGIRFEHLTWLTWYTGMNWWEQVGTSRSNFWSYGVKNTTWIPNLTLGIEEQNYVYSNPVIVNNALVGYVALNLDWNLKKGHGDE
jgi:hypothetical protein